MVFEFQFLHFCFLELMVVPEDLAFDDSAFNNFAISLFSIVSRRAITSAPVITCALDKTLPSDLRARLPTYFTHKSRNCNFAISASSIASSTA